jgi:hypothetical protein
LFTKPTSKEDSKVHIYIVAGLAIVLGFWRLSVPSDVVVKDSPEFAEALTIWHPVLVSGGSTLRKVKRFVNAVRYYSMQQGGEQTVDTVLVRLVKQLLEWMGVHKDDGQVTTPDRIPESILVSLGALYHLHPDLIKVTDWLERGEFNELPHLLGKRSADGIQAAMWEAIRQHQSRFGSWPPEERFRQRILLMAAGVRFD